MRAHIPPREALCQVTILGDRSNPVHQGSIREKGLNGKRDGHLQGGSRCFPRVREKKRQGPKRHVGYHRVSSLPRARSGFEPETFQSRPSSHRAPSFQKELSMHDWRCKRMGHVIWRRGVSIRRTLFGFKAPPSIPQGKVRTRACYTSFVLE